MKFKIVLLIYLLGNWNGVNCGTVVRSSLQDNIRSGIQLAGQMFGVNNALDVADLVSRAFSTPPKNQPYQNNPNDRTDQDPVNSTPLTQKPPIIFAENGSQDMMTSFLRVMGLDAGKIGAIALNGIIFIAQMIGRSLTESFAPPPTMTTPPTQSKTSSAPIPTQQTTPTTPIHTTSQPPTDHVHHDHEYPFTSPLDWLLDNRSETFQRSLVDVRDNKLTDRLIEMIESFTDDDGDCIKLLLCKGAPIIRGMQTSIKDRIDGRPIIDDHSNTNRLSSFFDRMPDLNELKSYGDRCKEKHSKCNYRREQLNV